MTASFRDGMGPVETRFHTGLFRCAEDAAGSLRLRRRPDRLKRGRPTSGYFEASQRKSLNLNRKRTFDTSGDQPPIMAVAMGPNQSAGTI
jgi:hypothetical protein